MTLARLFTKLRKDSGLSMRGVADRARPRVDATVIWKVEAGRPVRAKTLGQLLRALGLSEKDDAFIEAFALWSTEQAKTLPQETVARSVNRVGRAKARELDVMIAAIQAVPESDWPVVLEALKRPEALKLWVQSTRELSRK